MPGPLALMLQRVKGRREKDSAAKPFSHDDLSSGWGITYVLQFDQAEAWFQCLTFKNYSPAHQDFLIQLKPLCDCLTRLPFESCRYYWEKQSYACFVYRSRRIICSALSWSVPQWFPRHSRASPPSLSHYARTTARSSYSWQRISTSIGQLAIIWSAFYGIRNEVDCSTAIQKCGVHLSRLGISDIWEPDSIPSESYSREFILTSDNRSRSRAASLILCTLGPALIRRAKPDDPELLSEIQNTDPAFLPWTMSVGIPTRVSKLASKVVCWLQISFEVSMICSSFLTTITCSQKCRDPPQGTISLWKPYIHDGKIYNYARLCSDTYFGAMSEYESKYCGHLDPGRYGWIPIPSP